MSRRLLARGWALVGCACFATATGAASCSPAGSTSASIKGSTLVIAVSVPPGTLSPEAQDVLAAEHLAFQQSGARAGKYTLKLVRVTGSELSDNARQAIGDSRTIAYLGEIAPGTSADTIGITNAEDVLQVSPTDTALELTRSTPAISNTPTRYYESLATNGRTFARLVPTDALEAQATITQMLGLGIRHVYVATDGSAYGTALRAALLSRAGSAIAAVSAPTGADAVFYAGSSATGAAAVFNQAAGAGSKVKLFAPSALAQQSFVDKLSPAAQRSLYVSSPGFTAADLPAAGRQFVSAFRRAYGRAPATEAIFGYAAMAAVLHALQRAGSSAGTRSTVVRDFFDITNLSTAIGTISIDKRGDVSVGQGAPFVFSRAKAGKLVPFKPVQVQG
jgi:ABC-type branched-subunit amino acid transport system substrate-binding protein